MGGYGNGRRGGGPTVESEFAFRIDIDALRRDGLIRLGVRAGCVIRFSHPCRDLDVECETHIDGPWNDWVRLKYEMTDYWTGEPLAIDDKIFPVTSRPPFRWAAMVVRVPASEQEGAQAVPAARRPSLLVAARLFACLRRPTRD